MIVRKTTSILQKKVECLPERLIYQELFLLVTFTLPVASWVQSKLMCSHKNPFNGCDLSIGQAEAHQNPTSINKRMSS